MQSSLSILGRKEFPGINIRVDERGDVSIDLNVLIRYGLNIPDIAQEIQDVIKSAVKKTANLILKEINISVNGITKA